MCENSNVFVTQTQGIKLQTKHPIKHVAWDKNLAFSQAK